MSDLRTRINNGEFKNTLPYPANGDYDRFYVYSKGKVIEDGIMIADAEVRRVTRAEWARQGYTVEAVADKEALGAARKAYGAEDRRLAQRRGGRQ